MSGDSDVWTTGIVKPACGSTFTNMFTNPSIYLLNHVHPSTRPPLIHLPISVSLSSDVFLGEGKQLTLM
ncbi:hypothetical protein E2C01_085121 [Portunus trituberculatus]|uniref:Uncharacterized protein n=1 Tax=Portunus trituberculatus TaxID=210409 RepID=A0A5B7JB32_PORTR|nr:hypothetical protein [Portunus trituberculatus]